MKIKTRVSLFFSLIFILIFLLVFYFFNKFALRNFQNSIRERYQFIIKGLSDYLQLNEIKNIEELKDLHYNILDFNEKKRPLQEIFWISFYTENFELIKQSALAEKFPIENAKELYNSKRMYHYTFQNTNDSLIFPANKKNETYVFLDFSKINTPGFSFFVVTAIPITHEVEKIRTVERSTLIFLLVFFAIVFTGGNFLLHYNLNALTTITRKLRKISKDDLSQRINIKIKKDEIGLLTQSINGLLERLERSFNMEKQFISDISHEFKTPLAVMRLTVESVLDNPHISDEDMEKIGTMLETLYSMDFLVKKLLYLSRLEQKICPFHPEEMNICETARRVYDTLTIIADNKKLNFKLHFDEDNIMINGDKELLYMSLFNITENAIKYTDKGSVIIIIKQRDGQTIITVEDTGQGIPQKELENIFEKFYRIDMSRSKQKGYGIGLSITKRIIDLHRGKINIESIEGTKTKFEVILP